MCVCVCASVCLCLCVCSFSTHATRQQYNGVTAVTMFKKKKKVEAQAGIWFVEPSTQILAKRGKGHHTGGYICTCSKRDAFV